jgi:hypothetical protein
MIFDFPSYLLFLLSVHGDLTVQFVFQILPYKLMTEVQTERIRWQRPPIIERFIEAIRWNMIVKILAEGFQIIFAVCGRAQFCGKNFSSKWTQTLCSYERKYSSKIFRERCDRRATDLEGLTITASLARAKLFDDLALLFPPVGHSTAFSNVRCNFLLIVSLWPNSLRKISCIWTVLSGEHNVFTISTSVSSVLAVKQCFRNVSPAATHSPMPGV